MKDKKLLATIEIGEEYTPNKDIIIDDYNDGIFAGSIGTILIKKVSGGVSRHFKLIEIHQPMIDIDIGHYIVGNGNGAFFNVEEEGLVKLAYENKI